MNNYDNEVNVQQNDISTCWKYELCCCLMEIVAKRK